MLDPPDMSKSRSHKRNRSGVAAVEFALASAVLCLVVAVSIEFGRMNMIRHCVDNAAYEGARAGIVLNADVNVVRNTAIDVMKSAKARGVTVEVAPTPIVDDTPEIVVTVTVPAGQNGFITPRFFAGRSFVGECRLTRDDVKT